MSLELDRKSAVASGRVRPGAGRAMSTAWDHNSFVLDRLASHVLFPRDEARDDDDDDAIYNENLTIDVNNGDVTSSYFVESSAADNDMMNTPKIEMSDDEDLSPKNDFSATWGDLGFGGVVGHSEVIGEFTLPVHQSVPSPPQFVYVESSVFPTNPMEVVDPMEVEGRDRPPATWAQRKTKAAGFKRLSISMDVPEQVGVAKDEQAPAVVVVDTPAVEMLLADADCSFDLLDFTMNDEFPVDDPEFLKQLEVDSLSPTLLSKDPLEEAMLQSELNGLGTINISDIKEDEEEEEEKTPADDVEWVPRVPSKGKKRMEKPGKLKAPTTKLRATTRAAPYAAPPRRRGRPPSSTVTSSACSSAAPSPRPSTSSDHSYMWRDSTSGLSEDEVKDFKYRRMRDLNNEASKRCRQNRKQKSDEMERSEKELVDRNAFLRAKVDSLERKKQILTDWIKKKGLLAKGSTGE